MPDDPPLSRDKRAYRSTRRSEQARATRRHVLEAAGTHFLATGYAGSTLAAIAVTAGVSADTVYKTFASKIGLLKALLDVTIGGDDAPVALLDREGPQELRREKDQRVQVRMLAGGVSAQLERIRPLDDILRSAAAVDKDAAELRNDIQMRQRRAAMASVVSWIQVRGPLRDGLSVVEATQVVWTLTSPEVHFLMRDAGGWSAEAYRQWLEQALADAILVR